jgi:segregation and condensation protein A
MIPSEADKPTDPGLERPTGVAGDMTTAELYLGPPLDDENQPIEPRYHVRLPVFDGPLDLLLHLIRKNEVDIYDIPIAAITRQYLETLDLMRELNLDVAGEFVFMAATLIHIKSKMLLPPPHEDGTEDEIEDPRAELVARLLEYQRYKEAAQVLYERQTLRSAVWLRSESSVASIRAEEASQEDLVDVDLFELLTAFRSVMERLRQRRDITFEKETVTVEEMIQILADRVAPGTSASFEQLFEGVGSRILLVVTFLAILEMVRLQVFRIYQQKAFGTIHVSRPAEAVEVPRTPSFERPEPDVGMPAEPAEPAEPAKPAKPAEPAEPAEDGE